MSDRYYDVNDEEPDPEEEWERQQQERLENEEPDPEEEWERAQQERLENPDEDDPEQYYEDPGNW